MALLVVLLLALAPLPTTAQGQPATPDPAAAPIGVLAQFPIAALPTPHAEVWFLRMALAPGGLLPAEKQIGSVAAYVESGVLTLVSDQPVLVSPGGTGTPVAAAATPTAGGFVVALRPGESALISDGATLMVRNDAAAPTTFLVVVAYAAEREGEAGQGAEPVGLTQQGVSIAAAEFPAGPGRLAIERVEVKPGEVLASDTGHGMGIGGLELGAIEQGAAKATFATGSSWRWPGILNRPQDREPIDPGATVALAAGDGYSMFNGSVRWAVTSQEPLIVLRVTIMPVAAG